MTVEPAGRLARELHRLIHEAIVNAARHAGASLVRVEMHGDGDTISVSVTDNGTGFPFKGRYDLPALLASAQGPASLMERTIGLGGEFVVESTDHGARVEFVIPIAKPRKPAAVGMPAPRQADL
jgi:signal transduction histidine kinase